MFFCVSMWRKGDAWHDTFFGLHDPHKYTQFGPLIGFMLVYPFSKWNNKLNTKTKIKTKSKHSLNKVVIVSVT